MNATMQPFSPAYRDTVLTKIISWAQEDACISSAAIVGSLAEGLGDRWSDLDLTFAVVNGTSLAEVFRNWTDKLALEERADVLFDVVAGESLYRVFLLPGFLQVDISLTPEKAFAQQGAQFKLIFGTASEVPSAGKPQAASLLGYAVHHLLRARICIERRRAIHAEYWLHSARDYALTLACLLAGLPTAYGRGFDRLPPKLNELIPGCLAPNLQLDSIMAALRATVHLLLEVCSSSELINDSIRSQLLGLQMPWKDRTSQSGTG